MAIHFKQHSKVGEKAVAEAGFSLGDGHSTSGEYERKTLVNGAVFWFAVALFLFNACGPKLLQRKVIVGTRGPYEGCELRGSQKSWS